MTADQELKKLAPMQAGDDGVTYTVYRDGTPVQTGLTTTEFVVENATDGTYAVTATVEGDESAESNYVKFGDTTGISDVVTGEAESHAPVYSVDGRMVNRDGDLTKLPQGVYIRDGKKFVVK